MTPVNSTHVTKVGVYEDDLLIEYKTGAMYRYFGAAAHYETIIALGAGSVGQYIDTYLKKARVPFDKLTKVVDPQQSEPGN